MSDFMNDPVLRKKDVLETLHTRFINHKNRHPDVSWKTVEELLSQDTTRLRAVEQMELSGGEPDVILFNDRLLICDCAKESPLPRRRLCYDKMARLARRKNPPASSAKEEAEKMGLRLMTEAEYRYLQTLGEFDLKTSSWVMTPENIRALGGAIFCERRYGEVFVFHNGADSYYGVRGFRCTLELDQ